MVFPIVLSVCLKQSQLRGQARGISHSPEIFYNHHIISVCQVLRSFSIVVASGRKKSLEIIQEPSAQTSTEETRQTKELKQYDSHSTAGGHEGLTNPCLYHFTKRLWFLLLGSNVNHCTSHARKLSAQLAAT